MDILLFFVLFLSLLFLSRTLTAAISGFFYRTTRNYHLAIQILSLLFLPGVIFHELGHWFVASILLVPTGDIEFLPQVQGDSVKLGSVQVAKTDMIRRFFIGVAPIIFGLVALCGIFWFLSPSLAPITWKTILFAYALFEIGNTMFSSSKDLEGVAGIVILLLLVIAFLLFFRFPLVPLVLSLVTLPFIAQIAQILSQFLLLAILLDALCIAGIFLLTKLLKK